MNILIIGNDTYDVLVTSIKESFSVLYSNNTGRSLGNGAPMELDPLGTFFNYEVTVRRRQGCEDQYDALFDFVSQPSRDGVMVNIIHGQSLWKNEDGTDKPFEAYISQGARSLRRIDKNGKVYWDEMTLNIVPIKAQVLPE